LQTVEQFSRRSPRLRYEPGLDLVGDRSQRIGPSPRSWNLRFRARRGVRLAFASRGLQTAKERLDRRRRLRCRRRRQRCVGHVDEPLLPRADVLKQSNGIERRIDQADPASDLRGRSWIVQQPLAGPRRAAISLAHARAVAVLLGELEGGPEVVDEQPRRRLEPTQPGGGFQPLEAAVADHAPDDGAVLLLDPRLVVHAVGPRAGELDPVGRAIAVDGLVHEDGVVVRIEPEDRHSHGGCSGFTHVTACPIAQPPKAAFVTRLRLGRLLDKAARQLPGPPNNCLGGSLLHW
jgi:hypothetical protein